MTDSIVNFAAMPNSNPATIPAGHVLLSDGDPAGIAINNGSFRGKGGGRSGIRNVVPFTVVNDLVTVECVISKVSSDYSPGIGFTFDGLVNYHLYVGMHNFGIRRGATINSGAVSLGNVSRTSVNNVPYKLTYKPSTGELKAYADNVLIMTRIDTTYTGPNIYGLLYSSGYNSWNETVSYTAYNVNVYTVESINNGSPVYSGQNNIQMVTTGFTGLPTSITCTYSNGTKSIPVTNIAGATNNPTFTLGDRVDGADCPLDGTVLTFTVTNGMEVANITAVYTKQVGENAILFASPITDDSSYLTYHLANAGLTANAGTFYYKTPSGMSDLVIGVDGSISSTNEGTIEGWFIPLTGTSLGTSQKLNLEVKDSGIVRYGSVNGINTSRFPTATGITVGGIAVTGFGGSANVYQYTMPALTPGIVSPKIGSSTLSITDGTITDSYDVSVQPSSTQSYVTLTSVETGDGFVGKYVTCVVGDQIVFDKPATLGVAANTVTASGAIQTDFGGTQVMWHINGATGLVTQLSVITPIAVVDIEPNTFTFSSVLAAVPNTSYISNAITVTDVAANTDIPISITNGQYSVSTDNGTTWGAYTSTQTNVRLGYLVRVRNNSSASNGATVTTTLDIGGVTATYVLTSANYVLSPSSIANGVQNTLSTTLLSTANSLTVNDRSISSLAGSAGVYTFTVPALVAGNNVPLFDATAPFVITDGTTTVNGTASYIPASTKSFVTLTSVVNSIGYIGYYIPGCAVGDQLVFDTPATRSVAVNSIGADGRLLTDYHGTQTAYHIKASDGLVTELTISTPAQVADIIPNTYTFTDTSNSPLSTIVESNVITVTGVDAGQNVPVTITGGEYAVNTGAGFGAWTTSNTNVQLGWTIKVHGTSSTQFGTAVNVQLSVGGVVDTFTINTITADTAPDAFSFTSVTGSQLSSTATSASVAMLGFSVGSPVPISITNGTYSVDGGAYTAASGTINVNQTVSIRVNTPGTELTPTVATLNVGGVTGTFTATTRAYDVVPSAFSFTSVTNTALSAVTDSASITVAGIDTGANSSISISGGQYSINGGAFTSTAGSVQLGQNVVVRVTASAAYATPAVATLTIGTVSGTFTVTTRAADIAPTAFSFTAVTNAALSTLIESASITVAGVDSAVNVPVSVSSGEYSVYNGTAWSAYTSVSGNVQLGYLVKVRNTSAATDGQAVNTTLNIGGVTAIFTISTGAVDLAPTAFSFTGVNNVEPGTVAASSNVTVAGISAGYDTTIAVTNGEYRFHDGVSWSAYTATSGNVRLGYQVQVRHTAVSTFNTSYTTTLNIGGVSGTFVSTTRVADVLPNAFTLGTLTNLAPGVTYESTEFTVAGVDAAVPIPLTITNGEYSINNGAWGSVDVDVLLDDVIKVRAVSSAAFNTGVSATLSVGGRTAVFSVTTRTADVTPANLTFTANTNAAVNTVTVGNAITITGMDDDIDVPFTVTNGEASINDGSSWGAYVASGVLQNGYQVRLRVTTPAQLNQSVIVSFTIGTITGVWSVDTNSNVVTVDPFTFNTISNGAIRTVFESNIIKLSGGVSGTLTAVNISGGAYRAYYRNMATAWLTSPTQLPFGSEIKVKLTTSDNYNTQHNAVLTIGGYSASFRVTTKVPNTVPRNFTFNTITNAVKSTEYESNTAIIKGFDPGVQANVSITNGEYKVDSGNGFSNWTAAPSTVISGSVVKVRSTAPATAETTKLVTLSINGVAGVFAVITRKDPIVTTADDIVADFAITPIVNAEPNARIVSSEFTVDGIDPKITIPITVINGEYSIDGGVWSTSPGKVHQGNTVRLAGRCKSGYNEVNEVTVSVGAATRTFVLTTRAELTTLNAVTFYSVNKAPINTAIDSNVITIAGVDATFPVTLSTSGGLSYRIDRGLGFEEYTTADGSVKLGDRIQAQVTSSSAYETLRIGTLTINGTNVQFRVTTGVEPTLSVFSSIAKKVNTRRYRLTK